MRIIISPAKKMKVDTDSFECHHLPQLLNKTEQLYTRLRTMSYEELKALWCCSDQIATRNFEYLQTVDLYRNLTPAILAYEGIQYRYMAPNVFTEQAFVYVEEHLRILSGFYGVLRPFDGIVPYRLEMQAKLSLETAGDLYAFWGDAIAKSLFAETDCIVNLASKEYSRCVSCYLPKQVRFLTCVFGEWKNGTVVEKGTHCKMARGEMVRYMAEHQIKNLEALRNFDRLGYQFSQEQSNAATYVFLKEGEKSIC